MNMSTLKTDFKRELRRALLRLRDQSLLYDVMAITLLFLAFKFAASVILIFIDTRGFRAIHSTGTSYDKPVPIAEVPFYESLAVQTPPALEGSNLSLSDIATALNEARPDITPDFLQFSFETAPLLAGIISILMLCACVLPLIYFILNLTNDTPRPRIRRIFQLLVILGGAAWAVAAYTNGHWIRTPIGLIKSAGFWLLQGALCLHLFTDLGSKARRYAPILSMIAILLTIGMVNLTVTGRLLGRETGLYLVEAQQLHNAITSGWWASIREGIIHMSGWTSAIFILLFLVGEYFLKFILKRQPLLRTLLGWIFMSIFLIIGCAFLGVVINTPSQILIWQTVSFVFGMGCLRSMAYKPEHAAQAKAIIDEVLTRLESATTPPETEG